MQLAQIYDQMQLLAEQAKKNKWAQKDFRVYLHCRNSLWTVYKSYIPFIPKRNWCFSLSLVGPKQWGKSGANLEFVGTVKLLADHTWDILERNEKFDF